MQTHILAAPAKINLHLRIRGLRPDGYHELRTLFMPLTAPADEIRIDPGVDRNFHLRCPGFPELENADNLIHRAWTAFGEATGFRPGLFVTVDKRIPMGGGLGGGSSDCAAMLAWLNENAGERALSPERLNRLAASLGADVPFFLYGKPAWAEGIGEKLAPADVDLNGMTLVLACPDIHVNTGEAFRKWDAVHSKSDCGEPLTTVDSGTKCPTPVLPAHLVNDFETVVMEMHPRLREIKEKFLLQGAAATVMSGSGASIFALFRNGEKARSSFDALRKSGMDAYIQAI